MMSSKPARGHLQSSRPQIAGIYRLKTLEKVTHHIPATLGETNRLTDKNDNELRLRENGVFSNRGRSVAFDRDHLGRIIRVTDPRGNSVRYEYNAAGDLASVIDRGGNRTMITYRADQPHFLHQIIDPLGTVTLTASYDSVNGRMKSIANAVDAVTEFTYDLNSRTTTAKLPLGGSTSQSLDAYGNVIQVVDKND